MKLQPRRRGTWTSAGCLLQCYKRNVYVCLVGSLCDPVDRSPPGSSVHGVFQARILEWAALSIPRDLPDLGMELESLVSPALAGRFFTPAPPGKAPFYLKMAPKIQSNDARDLDLPKRSHKVLPVSEEVKILNLIKKKISTCWSCWHRWQKQIYPWNCEEAKWNSCHFAFGPQTVKSGAQHRMSA